MKLTNVSEVIETAEKSKAPVASLLAALLYLSKKDGKTPEQTLAWLRFAVPFWPGWEMTEEEILDKF